MLYYRNSQKARQMARPACQCLPTASLGSTCAGARQVGLIRARFLAPPETRATRPKRSALQSLQRRLIWAARTTAESSSSVAGMLMAPKSADIASKLAFDRSIQSPLGLGLARGSAG
jgi:hypothetical protein